jgi:hypothetical protein
MAGKSEMDPYIVGFGLSAAFVSIFNGILNVAKELIVINGDKVLKDGLLSWIGSYSLIPNIGCNFRIY